MPEEPLYSVIPYAPEELKNLLAAGSHEASVEDIAQKNHLTYFKEYFKKIGAKTIIVERQYIDRDYLEDFSSYYVRCFDDYRRKCTRLHFLKEDLTETQFEELLLGGPQDKTQAAEDWLQSAYLGFIVVKPLPQTIIGRTCLCTYEETDNRLYPITREYPVNLFGFSLKVKTLAFQEQDSVTAACATSALWSVFHGTGKLFQHHIPTPVEITKAATDKQPRRTRQLPNKEGLVPIEIAQAIRSVGLEPLLSSATEPEAIKPLIHAYLHGGIPLLLGFDLYDFNAPKQVQRRGRHAVAVTGYNLSAKPPMAEQETGFLRHAMRIDKLYVHDDQVGPFARVLLDGKKINIQATPGAKRRLLWSMQTSWRSRQPNQYMRGVPLMLFVPLYHKIRIPYDDIEPQIRAFDFLLNEALSSLQNTEPRLVWDIHLTQVGRLRTSFLNMQGLPGERRRELLVKPMPRFIWRALARLGDRPIFDMLFDATDIQQGNLLEDIIEYERSGEHSAAARRLAIDGPRFLTSSNPQGQIKLSITALWQKAQHILHWFSESP